MLVKPHKPEIAPSRGANTSASQIEAQLALVEKDGGSPITSYVLEMDSGTGFIVVSGGDPDDTTLLRVVTNDVLSG